MTVESDELIDDVDLGFALPATLAGIVWDDLDGDGTQNGETPRAGVDVELLDAGGTVIDTETTDGVGAYTFTGLLPGVHRVRPVVPAGSTLTSPDVGGDDTLDSDVLPATGTTAPIVVVGGSNITGVDAGLVEPGTIGDTVFADLDGDGLQDPGEPGIAGVTVAVRDAGGLLVATAVTAASGAWSVDVAPGSYRAVVTVPTGWAVEPGDDLRLATVVSGGAVDDADFPLVGARSLTGRVAYDVAGDSTIDASDPGLGGITVRSTWDGPDGPIVFTTVTDADGAYAFDRLPPGDHTVVVEPADLPDGIVDPTVDPDATIDLATSVGLSTGSTSGVDFGVTGTARLGDHVFVDADGDGELDAGEVGVAGVTVVAEVTTTAGVMTYTTVTDADGFYEFTELPAGDYVVSIDATTIPVGLIPSTGDRRATLVIGGADDSIDLALVPAVGPVAEDDRAATPPATPVVIDVIDNDTVPSGSTVTIVSHTRPTDGVVVLRPDGTFEYTPDAGFEGTDTFDYEICDLDAIARYGDTPQMRAVFCSTATVSVVTPPPPPGVDSSTDPDAPTTPTTTPPSATPTGTSGGTGGSGTPSSPTPLPRTGSEPSAIPLFGSLLLALGVGLRLVSGWGRVSGEPSGACRGARRRRR